MQRHSRHLKMPRRFTDFRDLGKDVSIAPGTTSDHWPKTHLSLPKRPYEATDPRVALNSHFSRGGIAREVPRTDRRLHAPKGTLKHQNGDRMPSPDTELTSFLRSEGLKPQDDSPGE